MNAKGVSFEQLTGIFACLALALAAHAGSMPLWVFAAVAVFGGVRLLLAYHGRPPPPAAVKLIIAGLAIAMLFMQFRTFNGLSAGTALLVLVAGLKLLETATQRDIYVITLIVYFVCLSSLLESESFWLLAYLIAVCWLTTATLLRLTSTLPLPDWNRSLRYALRIMSQALPLALVFWLFFPRFDAPLWQIPGLGGGSASGLGDTMSPGDINDLAMSDEIAFRVRFAAAPPPPQERYWRGPVMHDFDGHTWSRTRLFPPAVPALNPQGPAYRYTVSLEPHEHNWIFTLDWPARWNLPRGALNSDYTLTQPEPVSRPIDVTATSYTQMRTPDALSNFMRRRDLNLPRNRNPRTAQLAQSLRSAHPDDWDYVRAVLNMFTQQPFYYTLTPPKLADDSVDEFLFDTRQGFCGHYASAFTALMRAGGIPAHIVTGYQGGTFNRFSDYWIVRQSDAHAWTEVWIDGRGWVRVDPTAAIAPTRVEAGLESAAAIDGPLGSRWQRRTPWLADMRLRLDVLRQLWRERILLFDPDSQQKMLEWMNIPEPDGQKLVMLLAAGLVLVLSWLTWQVRREINPTRKELLLRTYERLCGKLAAAGVPRLIFEGPEDYAARVARHRPDLGSAVSALCRQYSDLRYAAAAPQSGIGQFAAAVRALRIPASTQLPDSTPQDSRGS